MQESLAPSQVSNGWSVSRTPPVSFSGVCGPTSPPLGHPRTLLTPSHLLTTGHTLTTSIAHPRTNAYH